MRTSQTAAEVVEELDSNPTQGLSEPQARQRLERYGYNELQEAKKDSLLKRFFLQFTDPLIIILIIAAVVSIAVDPSEWVTA